MPPCHCLSGCSVVMCASNSIRYVGGESSLDYALWPNLIWFLFSGIMPSVWVFSCEGVDLEWREQGVWEVGFYCLTTHGYTKSNCPIFWNTCLFAFSEYITSVVLASFWILKPSQFRHAVGIPKFTQKCGFRVENVLDYLSTYPLNHPQPVLFILSRLTDGRF